MFNCVSSCFILIVIIFIVQTLILMNIRTFMVVSDSKLQFFVFSTINNYCYLRMLFIDVLCSFEKWSIMPQLSSQANISYLSHTVQLANLLNKKIIWPLTFDIMLCYYLVSHHDVVSILAEILIILIERLGNI